MNNAVLVCEKLGKSFIQGGHEIKVLQDLDLEVAAGEKIAVIGVSGSGKTTLLNLLGGIDTPSSGRVLVNGSDLAVLGSREQDLLRNHSLGFVYQFHHLLGEFSALENVAMPLIIARRPWSECQQRARDLLTRVGLGARLAHRPSQLSGGERQRVAIARALVNNPLCVLMDEPTGNLDVKNMETITNLLISLAKEQGKTVVVATHDQKMADTFPHTYRMRDGKFESQVLSQ